MTKQKKLSAPLKTHGGKVYLEKWIIQHFPPHLHYVEPYAGGLAVLLAKDFDGISEVVNDLDGDLTNFLRVLASPKVFKRFRRIIQATPFSQELFREAAVQLDSDSAVDRAVKFFIRCRQSRQGLRKDFATLSKNRTRRGRNEQISSWQTAIDGLPEIHARLLRVVILNDDAVAVIRREDSANTLFYLDPPYLHETRVTTSDYAFEMSASDHAKLLACIAEIDGMFVLSGYRSGMYDRAAVANGWHCVEREIDCKASGAKTKPKRTECLWMNFEPDPKNR